MNIDSTTGILLLINSFVSLLALGILVWAIVGKRPRADGGDAEQIRLPDHAGEWDDPAAAHSSLAQCHQPLIPKRRPARSRRRKRLMLAFACMLVAGMGYLFRENRLMGEAEVSHGDESATPSTQPYTRESMDADRRAMQGNPHGDRARMPVGEDGYYIAPSEATIPDDAYGAAVRRGRAIFTQTGAQAGDYVGNAMACANCHLDAGRRPNAAPLWAAVGRYPAYREKIRGISTLEDRIMECFLYSMNAQASPAGRAPAAGSDVYRDLMSYMAWMADGVPMGERLPGAMFLRLPKPDQGYDPARGAVLYARSCAACHGADGQGARDESRGMRFPPLWGAASYNWGAGMARIGTAAGFIKANMPFGAGYSLSDQESWDLAAFLNSHERPRDPRQTGTVEQAANQYHEGEDSYYGKTLDGRLLGVGPVLAN